MVLVKMLMEIALPKMGGLLVLGNVVISKKILRTRKIMVMHSNEGESIVYVPTQTDCGSDLTTRLM